MTLKELSDKSAADAWAWYCRFADENGLSIWRVMRTVDDLIEHIDEDTGEVQQYTQQNPMFNKYRELLEREKGVRVMAAGKELYVQTRYREWTVIANAGELAREVRAMRQDEKATRAKQAEERRAQRANSGALAPPWTGINNCTGDPKTDIPAHINQLTLTI